jgi:uncharacterized membrane protein YkvA (DUF1232 family)
MNALSRFVDWVSAPYTVYLILRDPEVSRGPKIAAVLLYAALFAYLLLPFDVVPDVVPFAGWLDDLLACGLTMFVSGRFLPQVQLKEKNQTAGKKAKRILFIVLGSVALAITLGISLLAALIILIVKLAGG